MESNEITFLKFHGIEVVESIAQGGFASIYMVYHTIYKTYFALKKIPEQFFNKIEIDCLMAIDNPKIVHLYMYFQFNSYVYLIMEYCSNDLNKIIQDRERLLQNDLIHKYVDAIVRCVKVCHENQIAHCDIKPSNFLIDQYGRIKISDFGLSVICDNQKSQISSFKGTLYFMAPELFGIEKFNPMKADIWSLGVTMYFIATGKYPFNGLDQKSIRDNILKGLYNEDLIKDPLLRDVIAQCLEPDVYYRADINQILMHRYFCSDQTADRLQCCNTKKSDFIVKPITKSFSKLPKINSHSAFPSFEFKRIMLSKQKSVI